MIRQITSFSVLLFFWISISFAQIPGNAYHPETATGAKNIQYQFHVLRWQNPVGVNYNEFYLSYDSTKVANMDSSALIVSGYPLTVMDSVVINQQLHKPTRYFWCVVEYNSNGFAQSEIWHFTTTWDHIDFIELEDFSFGLGKWDIVNTGGCGWQLGEHVNYMLPVPSTDKVLIADRSLCANMINATAYYQPINNMQFMSSSSLEFDSDWKTDDPNDLALVELSIDNGISWSTVWERFGISDRSAHISVNLFSGNLFYDTIYTVQVRFRTVQNNANSWWAIDNVAILGYDGILTHVHPLGLRVSVIHENQLKSLLNWYQILPVINETIERKVGLPSDPDPYQVIDTVIAYNYTTSFIDTTISDSSVYTYRIGYNESIVFGDPWYVFSNEATNYIFPPVPVELISFSGNVLGGRVILNWATATELNNNGFEIQKNNIERRKWEKIGFVEGNGTTTKIHNYSFTDSCNFSGIFQYRLKQVDFDGSFEYSDIIEIKILFPEKFSLSQNYPNPFNPSTTIKYKVPELSFVTIKVYDVLGKEVATLVNEEKPAGEYEVEFGRGLMNQTLTISSGIYFYQLRAGDYVETKKMVLQK